MTKSLLKLGSVIAATGLFALGSPARASIVPIGAYRFEETSYDQIVLDESGNQLNGINSGFVVANVSGPPTFGSASNFQDGWVDLGTPPELMGLLSNFTLTAWIRPDSLEGYARIMGGSYGSGWGWGINNGNLRFTTYHIQDYDLPLAITPGEWNHVAVTFDSSYDATFSERRFAGHSDWLIARDRIAESLSNWYRPRELPRASRRSRCVRRNSHTG